MKYFIDTNVFLRVLIKENEDTFASCVNLLVKVKGGQIEALTSSLVLAEVGWTLGSYYKFSRKSIVAAIRSIVSLHCLKIEDEPDWLFALESYSKKNVKLIDCVIASKKEIREKKWTVVTFDEDFRKLGVLTAKPSVVK